jgi:hypothetical protein
VALFGFVYRSVPGLLPDDVRAQRYVWSMADRMLAESDVRLLVLPEDNFYYFTNLLVKAVHARGGKALIVPFTVVNMLEWSE